MDAFFFCMNKLLFFALMKVFSVPSRATNTEPRPGKMEYELKVHSVVLHATETDDITKANTLTETHKT